ncbi:MAG: ABC transporter permease [Planctomycetota bacterium]
MTALLAVFKREFKGYFGTPVAYVFLVAFLFLAALAAFDNGFFDFREASLRTFFLDLPLLFALFAPAIAMRLWSEERRSGTIEFLLTLPITPTQAVLGKFFASWAFFGVALIFTGSMVWTVEYLGDPDYGPILTGYLGAFLMAGAYLAVATFFSAVTKNQVIAFVLGAVTCLALVYAGYPPLLKTLDGGGFGFLADFAESISFNTHFELLQRGLVETGSLFALIAISIGFLASTIVMLQETKAR